MAWTPRGFSSDVCAPPPPSAPRPTLGHPPSWTAGHRGCHRTVRRRSAVAEDAHAEGGWGERWARALVRNRVTGQPPRASRRRRSSTIGAAGIPSPSTPTPPLHQPLFGNCIPLHGVAVGGDDTFALVASSRPFVYCPSRNRRPAPVSHPESPLGTVQRTPPGAVQRTPPRRPTRRYGRPLCPDSLWRLGWPGGAPPGRLDDPPGVMPACQSYLGHPPAPLPNTTLVRVWRPPRRAPRVHDKSTVKGGAASDPVPSHPAYSKNRPQPPPPPTTFCSSRAGVHATPTRTPSALLTFLASGWLGCSPTAHGGSYLEPARSRGRPTRPAPLPTHSPPLYVP